MALVDLESYVKNFVFSNKGDRLRKHILQGLILKASFHYYRAMRILSFSRIFDRNSKSHYCLELRRLSISFASAPEGFDR
jgi:hypothetical protein